MPIYVTVSEGPSPTRQRVILTSGDRRLSEAVFDAIRRIDAEVGGDGDPVVLPTPLDSARPGPADKPKGRITPLRHPDYRLGGPGEAGR